MSNDVVIPKKLMERVIDNLEYLPLDQTSEIIRQLRSLPETVSLEGVRVSMKETDWEEWMKDPYLPAGFQDNIEWVRLGWNMALLRKDHGLVAPVQSVGVDVESIKKVLDGWHGPEGSKIMVPAFALDHLANAILAHLTTTQSAPSMGSVPSVKDIAEVIDEALKTPWQLSELVKMPHERMAECIHTLLTGRGNKK